MLIEDDRERAEFDRATEAIYGGDPLAQVQHILGLFGRQAPQQGSYAKTLLICANEIEKARTHSDAVVAVIAERNRQIQEEGWTAEHDDHHANHEMAHAAACYAYPELTALVGIKTWPWASELLKVRDHRSNYVRAAALLLAEIERLDRMAAKEFNTEPSAGAATDATR